MILKEMFKEYTRLSTSKRIDGMSDSYKSTILAYLSKMDSYSPDYEGLRKFLLDREDLAHSSRAILARGIGRFFYIYKLMDKESFGLIKEMFKMPHKTWSDCTLDEKKVIEIFKRTFYSGTELASYRNPLIVMLLASVGLRVTQLVNIDLEDVVANEEYYAVKVIKQKEKRQDTSASFEVKKLSKRFAICEHKFSNVFDNYISFREEREPDTHALFISKNNTRLSTRQVEITVKETAEKLGYAEKITPHSFRHYFGTRMVKEHGIVRAAIALGHSDIKVTQKYIQKEELSMILGE